MAQTMGRCRSCGAPIRWVKTMHGRNHPIDAMPVPDGDWVLRPSAMGTLMVRYTLIQGDAERYTSHFATCPNADRHRRPRRTTHTSTAKAVGE